MTLPDGTETHTLTTSYKGRLDAVIASDLAPMSRSKISRLIEDGLVTVAGVPATRPSQTVQAGVDVVVSVPPPPPSEAVPQAIPLNIVYLDDDVVVIDKEPGMIVHPGAGHPDGTLVNALLHHLGPLSTVGGAERPGIVHRLDRGTSGLLVVARNDAAHAHLAAQFAAHTAGRRYLAVVYGAPNDATGTITSHLGRHPTDRVRFASVDEDEDGGAPNGRRAVTHWKLRARSHGLALMELRLETGRTHQIRVHLNEQGWPIVGDPLYGGRTEAPGWLAPYLPPERPLLHAWKLRFRHPRDNELRIFTAPVPADMQAVLEAAELVVAKT